MADFGAPQQVQGPGPGSWSDGFEQGQGMGEVGLSRVRSNLANPPDAPNLPAGVPQGQKTAIPGSSMTSGTGSAMSTPTLQPKQFGPRQSSFGPPKTGLTPPGMPQRGTGGTRPTAPVPPFHQPASPSTSAMTLPEFRAKRSASNAALPQPDPALNPKQFSAPPIHHIAGQALRTHNALSKISGKGGLKHVLDFALGSHITPPPSAGQRTGSSKVMW